MSKKSVTAKFPTLPSRSNMALHSQPIACVALLRKDRAARDISEERREKLCAVICSRSSVPFTPFYIKEKTSTDLSRRTGKFAIISGWPKIFLIVWSTPRVDVQDARSARIQFPRTFFVLLLWSRWVYLSMGLPLCCEMKRALPFFRSFFVWHVFEIVRE